MFVNTVFCCKILLFNKIPSIRIINVHKKKTQPLRPYNSVLICAPDNYRGCVVCACNCRLKSAP